VSGWATHDRNGQINRKHAALTTSDLLASGHIFDTSTSGFSEGCPESWTEVDFSRPGTPYFEHRRVPVQQEITSPRRNARKVDAMSKMLSTAVAFAVVAIGGLGGPIAYGQVGHQIEQPKPMTPEELDAARRSAKPAERLLKVLPPEVSAPRSDAPKPPPPSGVPGSRG
jgi:hypothetical protein